MPGCDEGAMPVGRIKRTNARGGRISRSRPSRLPLDATNGFNLVESAAGLLRLDHLAAEVTLHQRGAALAFRISRPWPEVGRGTGKVCAL